MTDTRTRADAHTDTEARTRNAQQQCVRVQWAARPRNCACLEGLDSAYSPGPRAKAKAENEAAG
eukprot:7684619-Alexandrium_andersonii.AAC.1